MSPQWPAACSLDSLRTLPRKSAFVPYEAASFDSTGHRHNLRGMGVHVPTTCSLGVGRFTINHAVDHSKKI